MKWMSFLAVVIASLSAQASVTPESISGKAHSIEQEYSEDMRVQRHSTSYPTTLKMRESLKVGVGASVGGSLGLMGLNLELNFEDADGVLAGFGLGPGYSSFQLAWKHAFDGDYLAPYTTAGYSRWYNSYGANGNLGNSDTLDRILTDAERREGRFGADFVFGAVGIQYNQLSGAYAGFSAYAEVMMMAEVNRQVLVPTGAVGSIYYF